jgi:hypothetical protein
MMDHRNPCCYAVPKSINVDVTINGYYLLCGSEYATNTNGLLLEFHSKEEKQGKKCSQVALVQVCPQADGFPMPTAIPPSEPQSAVNAPPLIQYLAKL